MKRSTDRSLTTHTGSLPRPDDLFQMIKAREQKERVDEAKFEARVRTAVVEVVRKQVAAGIDVASDGEMSKPDYSTYIKNRFTGFKGKPSAPLPAREARDFPQFTAMRGGLGAPYITRPTCVAPMKWKDFAAVARDIDNFTAAAVKVRAADYFMTAVSPGQAARFLGNSYYRSHEKYIEALGELLKDEYDAIAKAGFVLQVDCPDLGSGWASQFPNATLPEFRKIVRLHLEVLDHALRDVPPGQIRLHLCWGNYNGPHVHDIPLKEIVAPVLRSRAMAFSFEGANPRHDHEWTLWREVKLPAGKLIIPGVLDSTSNFVEHPELIAQRLVRYAGGVGRENVMAGTDCGFATFAGRYTVHPEVVWAKFNALREGAKLASARLWRKRTVSARSGAGRAARPRPAPRTTAPARRGGRTTRRRSA
jgi:5-methyltetrahydropteroyltriglutamate--homocysteine methyltransferase